MKILNKLTIRNLLLNKRRTIVTIIGIIISTSLMVGIGLLTSSFQNYMIEETISTSGSYHAKYSNLTKEDIAIITKEKLTYFYEKGLGFSKIASANEYKPYLYLNAISKSYFAELTLIEGSFPKDSTEVVIPSHLNANIENPYQVGDKITLNLGNRFYEDDILTKEIPYEDGEELRPQTTMTYTIVGIVERSIYESYFSSGYTVYTLSSIPEGDVYVTFNSKRNIIEASISLANKIGYNPSYIKYNSRLLALYGETTYGNIKRTIVTMLLIMLSLVSIGCAIVIYNSFAISVTERKRQFGLLSSIGASPKEIRFMIFEEAILISIIAIPLGILASYIGIGTVIYALNNLLSNILSFKLKLVTDITYIILPVIFMLITIFISIFLPSRRACHITIKEAIGQNDDIKINKKKIRTNKLVSKIFGIEGEIALKNIKRNKKKYRVTIISITISIVLFISFSSFLDYTLTAEDNIIENYHYDAYINVYNQSSKTDDKVNTYLNDENIQEYIKYYYDDIYVKENFTYTNKYLEYLEANYGKDYAEEFPNNEYKSIAIIVLDDDSYEKYKKDIGLTENKVILLNKFQGITYTDNKRVNYDINVIENNKISLAICSSYDDDLSNSCQKKLNNIYITTKINPLIEEINTMSSYKLIMNKRIYDTIISSDLSSYRVNILLKDKVSSSLNSKVASLRQENYVTYYNIREESETNRNLVIAIKLLVYGFISLITIIGLTSVFNTITTSISLRKREFAILRSIGLTSKGFNKMLFFESLFFGIKSLIYAIPLSLIVTLLIHLSMSNVISLSNIIIPYSSIIIAILFDFLIVLITMLYSGNKLKKQNIIDEIREENI